MKSIRLVAWKEAEGRSRVDALEQLGYQVIFEKLDPGQLLQILKTDLPQALIIDLSRSPAMGRDLAVALRVRASTRNLPLVFVGGLSDKVAGVRRVLPDAQFSSWEGIQAAIEEATNHPPAAPVVPESALAGYSGTPLPKKLGIKNSRRILLARAPSDFEETLGTLPKGARLTRRYGEGVDLILWFVRSRRELERDITKWASRVGSGGIWIVWPKQSSGMPTDLKQDIVRRMGLGSGLVDYKIAALDPTWSGLKFAVRKGGDMAV